jgi:hypothetical protein
MRVKGKRGIIWIPRIPRGFRVSCGLIGFRTQSHNDSLYPSYLWIHKARARLFKIWSQESSLTKCWNPTALYDTKISVHYILYTSYYSNDYSPEMSSSETSQQKYLSTQENETKLGTWYTHIQLDTQTPPNYTKTSPSPHFRHETSYLPPTI